VVTRYYGGTKLGKGGLVRAYGGCVQHALETLPTIVLVERRSLLITVGYSDVELLRRLLAVHEATIADESYTGDVQYSVAVPVSALAAFQRELMDATAGRATIAPL
jgi:putative IMPACT (imprinted ancient) family translation regulator